MINPEEQRRVASRLPQIERDQPGTVEKMLRYFHEMDAAFEPIGGKEAIAKTAADILHRDVQERFPGLSKASLLERLKVAVEVINPPASVLITVVEQIGRGKEHPIKELDNFIEYCSGVQSVVDMN